MNKFLFAAAIIALSSQAQAYDKHSVTIGLGISDVLDANDKEPVGNVEWRGSALERTSTLGIPNVSPLVGASLTTEGAGIVYAGFLYDWNVYDAWSLVPSLSAGLYWDGNGKDMGGMFQVRPAIEVNYKLDASQRVGVNFAHISNLGLYDHNPGKEELTFNYSFAY